jgi:hypothetical protein
MESKVGKHLFLLVKSEFIYECGGERIGLCCEYRENQNFSEISLEVCCLW